MNLRQVAIIYAKELTDILRDRRTLISMILVPILMFPVLMGGMGALIGGQVEKMEKKTYTIAIVGEEHAPGLFNKLKESGQFQIIDSIEDIEMIRGMLQDKTILVAMNIPPGFENQLWNFFAGEGEAPELCILSNESEVESEIVGDKIINIVNEYRRNLVSDELVSRELRGDLTEPFTLSSVNVASEKQMGGFVAGMILPYIVIILTLIGAMYPAIDLTAGEKERGTLETLLIAPVGRMELVLGKFLTVMTASLATAILAITSMTITMAGGFTIMSSIEEGMRFSLSSSSIIGLLLLMIPLAMLFSALLMTIAVFARSYREAQSYISPLMIVIILPAMISYIPGVEPNFKLMITPIVNVALGMKDILMGDMNYGLIAAAFFSTIFYAGIAVFMTFRQFQRESVLFRV